MDPQVFAGATVSADQQPVAFGRARAAGTSRIRLILYWRWVAPAPTQKEKPAFDADDPGDPNYRWDGLDRQVKLAHDRGLEPIINITSAPDWAEGPRRPWYVKPGTWKPDPAELALFAKAAAERYKGSFVARDGTILPAVHYWQVWNEPNLSPFLRPQYDASGNLVSPGRYRKMVNAFAGAVHSVVKEPERSNVVVAGGLAPFGRPGSIAPLRFLRKMLCLSTTLKPTSGCAAVHFDAWSHHPYTSGPPTHHAYRADDVSLGDLPELRRALQAAIKYGHVVVSGDRRVGFWVTEFSWDSDPPDRWGVPSRLHARWVAEALYRMWRSGVSVVTWYRLRDLPVSELPQSGLYRCSTGSDCSSLYGDRKKLALRAFRFPFVAFKNSGYVSVWLRTPWGRPAYVRVERSTASGWRTVWSASGKTDRYGILRKRVASSSTRPWRARVTFVVGEKAEYSQPFSLARPRACFVRPFGNEPADLKPYC